MFKTRYTEAYDHLDIDVIFLGFNLIEKGKNINETFSWLRLCICIKHLLPYELHNTGYIFCARRKQISISYSLSFEGKKVIWNVDINQGRLCWLSSKAGSHFMTIWKAIFYLSKYLLGEFYSAVAGGLY